MKISKTKALHLRNSPSDRRDNATPPGLNSLGGCPWDTEEGSLSEGCGKDKSFNLAFLISTVLYRSHDIPYEGGIVIC